MASGALFANYDFKSSTSLSSPSKGREWKFTSPEPSTSNTPVRSGSVKSLLSIPAPATTYGTPSADFFSSSVKAWVPPPPSPGTPLSRSQRGLDTSSLGYLAFPSPESTATETPQPVPELAPINTETPETTLPASPTSLEEKYRARLEREQAEIIRGEEDWVRSGGILRDSDGKRDFARTEKIREELRLREWEKEVQGRFDEYERRWAELLGRERRMAMSFESQSEELKFGDIPWPVYVDGKKKKDGAKSKSSGTWNKLPIVPKVEVSDLTMENVEAFLTDPLKVRGCKISRKERVRSSFLRWHPDKITRLISKVTESDRKDVEDGIGAIVRCLQEMNSKH